MTDSATPRFWHALPHAPAPGTVLGQRDALPDGQATLYNVPGTAKPFGVLLLRSGQEVTAYVNRCAHFGVPLAAKQEHLIYTPHASITCNVHYARYRWADGVCESGECEGEALLPIRLTVDAAGQISIAAPGADSGSP